MLTLFLASFDSDNGNAGMSKKLQVADDDADIEMADDVSA